jgi:cyclic pyranopterin phosphate synthase
MRRGTSDLELQDAIRMAVRHKWAGHRINQSDFVAPTRSMSQIGG